MSSVIFVLNGPNTNLYGLDPEGPYGNLTLGTIEERCRAHGQAAGLAVECRQTNHEGVLIDWIQEARTEADAIVINAASLTYTSVGVLDALLAYKKPIMEVHMSNIYKREPFRHHSFVSKAATGIIAGFGPLGYELAITAAASHVKAGGA
jgi:3-dehydroquinate dehydratase-2